MKKITAGIMAGFLVLQMSACGGTAAKTSQDTETESGQSDAGSTAADSDEASDEEYTNEGLANPWSDITEEQASEMVPNLFCAPEGATDIRWSALEDTDDSSLPGPLVQLKFDLDGNSFTERAQVTGDEETDITGMYFDWTVTEDVTLANWGGGSMKGKSYRYIGEDETVDLITWYDEETGVCYCLDTSASDLDGFDIQAVAEATYAK